MGADEGLEARVGEAGRQREETLMPNEDNQARWVDPSIFLLDTPGRMRFLRLQPQIRARRGPMRPTR